MKQVQIVVTYNDNEIGFFTANVWRISSAHRCIVIGRGLPRLYIPLDNVHSFTVEELCDGAASTLAAV